MRHLVPGLDRRSWRPPRASSRGGKDIGGQYGHPWTLVPTRAGPDGRQWPRAFAAPTRDMPFAFGDRAVSPLAQGVLSALALVMAAGVTLWMAGAIYYDICNGARYAPWLAAGWALGVIAMFVAWQPLWQPFAVLLGVAALFLGWWFRL